MPHLFWGRKMKYVSVLITVEDIERAKKFYVEVMRQTIAFIHETREQPWRQRVARFYDPDKNIIEVGESLEYLSFRLSKEGKSLEEISKLTGMPGEFVEKSIEARRLQ
jgi:hypothetical protein